MKIIETSPLFFTPISLARQEEYQQRLAQMPQLASDYSFVNLWAWAEEYALTWAWQDDLVWIRQETPHPCYWAPVGDWQAIDWHKKLAEIDKLPFIRVPEHLMKLWSGLTGVLSEVHETREHWDYLYLASDLATLSGNRFHGKKNLLRQFKSKYQYEYVSLDKSFIGQVLLMQFGWCAWRDCEASAGLAAENRVINKVLESYGELHGLRGGALLVEDDIVAFTVAEPLGGDTLVIHFEKGMGGYKGVYQAINQMFVEDNQSYTIVNREQDLGNEGLRKAKLSYNPVVFLKKYRVAFF